MCRFPHVPSSKGSLLFFLHAVENAVAAEYGQFAKFIFDSQQLVVFRYPFASRSGPCFDLTHVRRNSKIGYVGVFRFTGTVRDNTGITRALRHLDGSQGFGDRADLVELDENTVWQSLFLCLRQRSSDW